MQEQRNQYDYYERQREFFEDMRIRWRWYSGRGMFGKECPAAVTSVEVSEEDIIRATKVSALKRDSMGLETILYTG